MLLRDLKQFQDKKVRLQLSNGEVAVVKVALVDDEHNDVVADVLRTSEPTRYKNTSAAYTFAASDIVAAELVE
jgi:hypothetical protein